MKYASVLTTFKIKNLVMSKKMHIFAGVKTRGPPMGPRFRRIYKGWKRRRPELWRKTKKVINMDKMTKETENQTVKNQKNTQESMKAFLRGKYEAIKASCEESNCSELGTDELEESKGDFLFFADRAMRVVTKLIDAHEISLSEENVDRWFSILLGNMIRTYGRLSDYQHATCAFILEGKTMVVDVYETEEGKYTVRTQMVNPAE